MIGAIGSSEEISYRCEWEKSIYHGIERNTEEWEIDKITQKEGITEESDTGNTDNKARSQSMCMDKLLSEWRSAFREEKEWTEEKVWDHRIDAWLFVHRVF